ncbi:MAG: LppX LprAFG lipoprotein [Patescibacteria group bacterium]|nr:LppX LprAFG lipoprotein [Patescibacteria group bacterium]
MKCPNCGKDGMVQSRAGWLCLSCGHLKRNEPTSINAQITTGKDAHAQMSATITGHDIHKAKDEPEEPKPEPEAPQPEAVTPPPPSAAPPWVAPTDAPDSDAPKADEVAEPDQPEEPGVAPEVPKAEEPEVAPEDVKPEAEPEPVEEPEAKPEFAEPAESPEEEPAEEEPESVPEPPVEPEPPALPAAPTEPEPDAVAEPKPDPDVEPPKDEDDPAPVKDESKPTPEKLVAETAPGVPAPATLPLNGKPPLKPVTHPRPVKPAAVAKVIVGLVAVAVIAGAGFLYLYQPKVALAAYLKRLSAAKTGAFVSTSTGQAGGYRFALQVSAKASLADPAKPKVALTANGALNPLIGAAEAGTLSASLTVVDGQAYIKAKNTPDKLFSGVTSSDQWQKYDPASSGLSQCLGSGKGLSSLIANAGNAQLPVTAASFAGLDTVNGTQTLHYRGRFDRAKLQTYLNAVTKDLAPSCKIDASHLTAAYEVWQGLHSDRLKLTLSDTGTNTTTEVTLDSNSYNQPVNIQAPSVSQPASASPSPTAGATPKPASAAAHDTQRKADLAAYIAAYKAIAVNGFYPISPPTVSVKANDPSTAKPYVVSRVKPTALGQIEYRPGGACIGAGITPGATGSRYLAVFTTLENGQTACADNR